MFQERLARSLLLLFAFSAGARAQVPRLEAPDFAAPEVALPPTDVERLRELAGETSDTARTMGALPPAQAPHALLDDVLAGGRMPVDARPAFVSAFEADRAALHRELDEGRATLARIMQQRVDGTLAFAPRAPGSLLTVAASPATAAGFAFRTVGRSPAGAFRRVQDGAGTANAGNLNITWSDSDDIVRAQSAGDAGDGQSVRMSSEQWKDTPRWVADNETDVGFGISKAREAGGKGAGASFDINFQDHARVQRCPAADGVVTGKGKFSVIGSGSSSGASGTTQSSTELTEEFVSEGHVQDDAVVKDVRVEVDLLAVKRASVTDASGHTTTEYVNGRFGGVLTFDPHNSDDEVPMEYTRCATAQGSVALDVCKAIMAEKEPLKLAIRALRKAYLKAEKEWSFEDGEKSSKCVTVTFAPKSETKHGEPNESVPVEATLVAINGQQPTAGTFAELEPFRGGRIGANGARTVPREPAKLAYTAPAQPWSTGAPPGFDVVKAKSRAGVFMREHASADEYRWLLKPGPKLSIHNLWQTQAAGIASLSSEATFSIDLQEDGNGRLSGQAVVPRTYQSVAGMGGVVCQATGQWTETWIATAKYDETGEMLNVGIRYHATAKQGVVQCPTLSRSYANPAIDGDKVTTPLSSFTMPAAEGSTKQFAFGAAFTKNVIDVTVVKSGAAAGP